MSKALNLFNSMQGYTGGKRLFSWLVCRKARYFGTIKPYVVELKPGKCVIKMKKRKAVTNHLNTVHAIAMCNIVELAGGMGMDVSIPDHYRWIPSGMTVEYLALAKTDLTGIFETDINKIREWDLNKPYPAIVNCLDTDGKIVMRGTIDIHLSLKKKEANQ
jgi:hypothetical protein